VGVHGAGSTTRRRPCFIGRGCRMSRSDANPYFHISPTKGAVTQRLVMQRKSVGKSGRVLRYEKKEKESGKVWSPNLGVLWFGGKISARFVRASQSRMISYTRRTRVGLLGERRVRIRSGEGVFTDRSRSSGLRCGRFPAPPSFSRASGRRPCKASPGPPVTHSPSY
jgi:hypothetical protein